MWYGAGLHAYLQAEELAGNMMIPMASRLQVLLRGWMKTLRHLHGRLIYSIDFCEQGTFLSHYVLSFETMSISDGKKNGREVQKLLMFYKACLLT